MPKQATGELEVLADGRFAARVTIVGRTRRQFILTVCASRPAARERTTAMSGIGARLRKAGLGADVEKIMRLGASARPGKSWDAVLAAVDLLCTGGTEEAKAQVIPTFAEFAEEWTTGRLGGAQGIAH